MLKTILLQHVFTHVHDVSTLPTAKTRKLRYFTNATKSGDCLEKKITQGTLPVESRKERPKTSWNGNISAWTGLKPDQLMWQVEEHLEWRHSANSPWTEHGRR